MVAKIVCNRGRKPVPTSTSHIHNTAMASSRNFCGLFESQKVGDWIRKIPLVVENVKVLMVMVLLVFTPCFRIILHLLGLWSRGERGKCSSL